MEAKYKSLSLVELFARYPDHRSCLKRLADRKWRNGYKCVHCGHDRYCAGDRPYTRQCTSCHYIESPTANTLFHKVKFPLNKAFAIAYFVANAKSGVSSTELSRRLQLRQKTCWLFKQKVMKAMSPSISSKLTGRVEVREFIFGHYQPPTNHESPKTRGNRRKSRKAKRLKKRAVVAIERRGAGASRIYGQVIHSASASEFESFMERTIAPTARVVCSGWPGYKPLEKKFEGLIQSPEKEKSNDLFPLKSRALRILQWLRGTHGHAERLQGYLDEFSYRYNRHKIRGDLMEALLDRMLARPPCSYRNLYL